MEFLLNLDFAALLKIVFLDLLLGGDNAIVIALACSALPTALRRKGMVLGTAAAIGLRVVVLAAAYWLIQIPYLKVFAGLMLIYIGVSLTLGEDSGPEEIHPEQKLWAAIRTIAVADLVMSIDNVFAVTGASQSAGQHSLAYACFGILVSIPIIIAGASVFTSLIDKYPAITWFGGGLLGYVGGEMIASDTSVLAHTVGAGQWVYVFYVTCAAAVLAIAYLGKKYAALANPA